MKKVIAFVILVTMVTVVAICAANGIERQNLMDCLESSMKATAEYTGMGYLGFVDVDAISKGSGFIYNGQAIRNELLSRAGMDEDSDIWMTTVGFHKRENVYVCKLIVYENGQSDIPVLQRKVKAEYLYGEIF